MIHAIDGVYDLEIKIKNPSEFLGTEYAQNLPMRPGVRRSEA